MSFTRSRPRQKEDLLLMILNNIIQRTKCMQFLGLPIDEKLSWQEHTNACKKKKLTTALYIINKVNRYLPVVELKIIYYTLVYPT